MQVIKVLSDREFEALPYKHLNKSYGIADPKKDVAYVRRMGRGLLGSAVEHEVGELIDKFSPDEDEDGMRHGWFHDLFGFSSQPYVRAIAPVLGGMLGGPFGALGGALGAAGASALAQQTTTGSISPMQTALSGIGGYLGAGSSAFQGGVATSKAAGGGYLGQALTGAKSMLIGLPASSGEAGMSMVGGGVGTSGGVPLAGATRGMLGYGGQLGASAPAGMTAGALASGASASAGWGADIMKGLSNPLTQLGLGVMGMSALPVNATPPSIGDIASKWLTADTVTKAGAAAKNMADTEYGGEFQPSNEILGFIEVQGKDIDKSYDQRLKQMDNSMGAINTNWARSGERLEMHRRVNEERQREKDTMQANWLVTAKQEHSQRQYTYIMDQLKLDDATKRELLYADMADIITKYNVEQQDILNFRKIAADAGMYMMQQGMEE